MASDPVFCSCSNAARCHLGAEPSGAAAAAATVCSHRLLWSRLNVCFKDLVSSLTYTPCHGDIFGCSLLKEWDTTPLVDSTLGSSFLTALVSSIRGTTLPDKARYALFLPCTYSIPARNSINISRQFEESALLLSTGALFDVNPWAMARLDSRSFKLALSPLLPSLLPARGTVHAFCTAPSQLQTTMYARNGYASEVDDSLEMEEPTGSIGERHLCSWMKYEPGPLCPHSVSNTPLCLMIDRFWHHSCCDV
jgi:hypothetical protein